MPEIERATPPYVQIAESYRRKINSGEMPNNTRLPPANAIAQEWHVAPATAHKALKMLESEHLVVIRDKQGAWVSKTGSDEIESRTKRTRINQVRVIDQEEVTEAGLVRPHEYVASLLGTGVNEHVIRRESIHSQNEEPVVLSVSWLPAKLAEAIPELLRPEPIEEDLPHLLAARANRRLAYGRDWYKARIADAREANALNIPINSPVLAATSLWSDDDGVVEYYEYVARSEHVINYGYNISQEQDQDA